MVEHAAPADVVMEARRMGPLPWSALGRSPAIDLPVAIEPWLAEVLDRVWVELGRPDPLVVVEAGAGDGRRGAGVLGLEPACRSALRWLLVDDDPDAAAAQRLTFAGSAPSGEAAAGGPAQLDATSGEEDVGRSGGANARLGTPGRALLRAGSRPLILEDPALVLGPALAGPDPDEEPTTPQGIGPVVASLPDLPACLPVAVVLAIGWLSRLPVDCFEWRDGRWWEVRLAAGGSDTSLAELLVDAGGRVPVLAGAPTGGTPARGGDAAVDQWGEGDRVANGEAARRWLATARRVAQSGRVIAVDRVATGGGGDLRDLDLAQLRAAPDEVSRLEGDLASLLSRQWPMLGG